MRLRRTVAAVALSLPSSPVVSAKSSGGVVGLHVPAFATHQVSLRRSYRSRPYHSLSTVLSTVSGGGFTAPSPPSSKGTAVFDDLDLTVKSSEATRRNAAKSSVFCITGGNRGIGLQFVKSLLHRTKGTVVACCRAPENAPALEAIKMSLPEDERSRLQVQKLDIEDQSSIEEAAESIKSKFGRVDVLLNVAGILGDGGKTTTGPERSLAGINRQWFEKNLAVNVVGPVMLTQALAPLLQTKRRHGSKKGEQGDDSKQRPTAVVANLSARVGSISDNELGGWYSYRISKSALNQAVRTIAHEGKRQGFQCIALHPGTTDTDLSRPFQRNVQDGRLFPVDFTVSQLLDCIDSLDDVHSGGLYDWSGKALPF
jgi:NAD(P)-dependent dehydrogenase (short-subunit alcohol dehydrogenase family)